MIGALRYDSYELNSRHHDASGDRISPKVTVGVTPVNGFTVYGTYAEGYRAPAVTETLVAGSASAVAFCRAASRRCSPSCRTRTCGPRSARTRKSASTSNTTTSASQGDKLRVKANVFRNDVEDYIELVNFGPPVRVCPPGAPVRLCNIGVIPLIPLNTFSFSQYQNIGNARIEGVEFEGTYDTGDWFVGLSGQHIRGRDTTGNLPLLTVQPDQIASTFGVRLLRAQAHGVGALAGGRGEDGERDPGPRQERLPGLPAQSSAYNLVNLYIGYQPTPDVLASFGIDNLFNQYYVQYMNAEGQSPPGSQNPPPYVFPSPGITFKGGLKIRFGA